MPGPNSKPNGVHRDARQMIPPKLAARIADWEKAQAENRNTKLKYHKPGSQK